MVRAVFGAAPSPVRRAGGATAGGHRAQPALRHPGPSEQLHRPRRPAGRLRRLGRRQGPAAGPDPGGPRGARRRPPCAAGGPGRRAPQAARRRHRRPASRRSARWARCATTWSGSTTPTSRPASRRRPPGLPADAEATATYAPSSRRAGERFRILRFHREGGLGRVYVARDEELGREVALKEIRPDKVAEADLRGRFVLEAEINGGLEHPGIVPVYSLGTYDDGRPFYAMRFVEGDSLKEAIESYHKEHPAARPECRRVPQAAGPVHRRLRGDRLCAQQGGAAPRSEAAQRDAGSIRRDAADRLGAGQGDRPPRARRPGRRPRGDAGAALRQRPRADARACSARRRT